LLHDELCSSNLTIENCSKYTISMFEILVIFLPPLLAGELWILTVSVFTISCVAIVADILTVLEYCLELVPGHLLIVPRICDHVIWMVIGSTLDSNESTLSFNDIRYRCILGLFVFCFLESTFYITTISTTCTVHFKK
jgi:hypothetical protein